MQLHHLGINPGLASIFQRLAGHLVYSAPVVRPPSDAIVRRERRAIGALATEHFRRSADRACCASPTSSNSTSPGELLHAHEYWRMKRFAVDLVFLNERSSSYVQDLQIALETLVRQSRSLPQSDEQGPPGHVFVLTSGPYLVGDLGISRVRGAGRAVRRTRTPCQSDLSVLRIAELLPDHIGSGARSLPSQSRTLCPERRVLQRSGWLRRGRPRICDDPRPWPIDAGAVDQRCRQSWLRLPGVRGRRRLRLVGEQPRASADAVVERSGHRSSGRGVLSHGRRDRGSLEPHCAADPRRGGAPMSRAMEGVTAGSSTPRTASLPSSCSTCHSPIR